MSMPKKVLSNLLKIHPKVKKAIETKAPVIALESTILTHGLPYPENFSLIKDLQSILLEEYNVIPATIALQQQENSSGRENRICVGLLEEEELHDLCIANCEERVRKVTTRDLPFFLSSSSASSACVGDNGKRKSNITWGGTTVASTMHIASLVGISTFVTGGTGGVHRRTGPNSIVDISSDLMELSRSPVLVISAGIKSILDITQTLEALESLGVPTAVYQSEKFPAFFSPFSDVPSPYIMNSVSDIAHAFLLKNGSLGMDHCGMLVAVPNPSSVEGEKVEEAIQIALKECSTSDLITHGRDVTPFILQKVNELTKGDSLKSNIALIHNNVRIGAQIAIEMSNIRTNQQHQSPACNITAPSSTTSSYSSSVSPPSPPPTSPNVVVMGGSVIDIIAKPVTGKSLLKATSNPGTCLESDGGVARNIYEVLSRLGTTSTFYSAVGSDTRGHAILSRLHSLSHNSLLHDSSDDTSNTIHVIDESHTATYIAILDQHGDLNTAIADMDVMDNIPVPTPDVIKLSNLLLMDVNAPIPKLLQAAQMANYYSVPIFLEPTSVPKARKIAIDSPELLSCITYASPNYHELLALLNLDIDTTTEKLPTKYLSNLAKKLLLKMKQEEAYLLLTLGPHGLLYASKIHSPSEPVFTFQTYPVTSKLVHHFNCTGAGDTLVGAYIHAIVNGYTINDAVVFSMDAASVSLQCVDSAISPDLDHLKLL